MRTKRGNRVAELDVGKMVRTNMVAQRMTHAMLARSIKRNHTTVKRLLYNTSIQTYILWELSMALNHNFFTDLAAQLNAATEGELEQEAAELEKFEQENRRLREERDYLRKAIDMIEK